MKIVAFSYHRTHYEKYFPNDVYLEKYKKDTLFPGSKSIKKGGFVIVSYGIWDVSLQIEIRM